MRTVLRESVPNYSWFRGLSLENVAATIMENSKRPCLFKSIFPDDPSILSEVLTAFQNFQNPSLREQVSTHARIYLEEKRQDNLASLILEEKFFPGESLSSFVKRVCNTENFSLIINNFEQICLPLAAHISKFLQSIFAINGMPIGGCEQVVFAGNYSGTAFGVHEGYEHAFLIHLGPGIKDFYCWSQEKYLELTGGNRVPTYGDYIWMLEYAEKFVLEPGDILYLPALVYHVGRQTDFSVSVAVPLYTYPKERFFFKVVIPEILKLVPFDLEGMSDCVPVEFDKNSLWPEFSPYSEKVFSVHLKKELELVLAYRWYRLISNGGWEIPSRYSNSLLEETSLNDKIDLEENCKILLIPPFKICWEKSLNCSSNQLRVFIRAHSLIVPYYEELITLFKRLNNEEIVTIEHPELLSFFGTLFQTGGLDVIGV